MRGLACLQVAAAARADPRPSRCPFPFSTCHVVLSKEYYVKTVSDGEPSDEENDLLDLACAKLRSAARRCLTRALQLRIDRNVPPWLPGQVDASNERHAGSGVLVTTAATAFSTVQGCCCCCCCCCCTRTLRLSRLTSPPPLPFSASCPRPRATFTWMATSQSHTSVLLAICCNGSGDSWSSCSSVRLQQRRACLDAHAALAHIEADTQRPASSPHSDGLSCSVFRSSLCAPGVVAQKARGSLCCGHHRPPLRTFQHKHEHTTMQSQATRLIL